MQIVKKIAAVIVMVLSVLLLIVMLGGVAGVWWVRGEAVQAVTSLADLGDRTLERAQGVVDQVDDQVQRGITVIDLLLTQIERVGASAEENRVLLLATDALFDTDLTPKVQRLAETGQDVRDTAAVVDQVLTERFAASGRDGRLLDIADAIIEKVDALGQGLTDVQQRLQDAKSTTADKIVGLLTEPLDKATTKLETLSTEIKQVSQRIDERQANLLLLRDRINGAITLIVVVLTLILLWMALAQLGLFVHAYGAFTGRDPLARWHKWVAAQAPQAPEPQPPAPEPQPSAPELGAE
jgi:hypothetical protein